MKLDGATLAGAGVAPCTRPACLCADKKGRKFANKNRLRFLLPFPLLVRPLAITNRPIRQATQEDTFSSICLQRHQINLLNVQTHPDANKTPKGISRPNQEHNRDTCQGSNQSQVTLSRSILRKTFKFDSRHGKGAGHRCRGH